MDNKSSGFSFPSLAEEFFGPSSRVQMTNINVSFTLFALVGLNYEIKFLTIWSSKSFVCISMV